MNYLFKQQKIKNKNDMKHSEGKWESRGNVVFIGGTYKGVATIHVQKNYEDSTFKPIQDMEQIANTKLICAAPEMLEIIKKTKDILNNLRHPNNEDDEKLNSIFRNCQKLIDESNF